MLRSLHTSLQSTYACAILVAVTFAMMAGHTVEAKTLSEKRAEVFSALNLDLPELSQVKAAVLSNNNTLAQSRFADYLRQRDAPTWYPLGHARNTADYNAQIAANAINSKVYGGYVNILVDFPNDSIDWFYNPTTHSSSYAYNPEWQWQLNRMFFWSDMARAYAATNDERYALAWRKQLRSFLNQCQVPSVRSNGQQSAWRTIEAGLRMHGAWPVAFHAFLNSPSISDEDIILYVHSTLEHANYLKSFPTTGNWLTMEMNGLYAAGVVFPEFKDAVQWRDFAIDKLYGEITKQFLPDGAQYELTPGYHNVALENILGLPRLADAVDRFDELPADYSASLERAYDYNLYMTTPDRGLPKVNDSWRGGQRGTMGRVLDLFPHRADYLWIATDGKHGTAPTNTSYAFDWAGYFVMRSGWSTDANFALFDVGYLGYSHVHQDKLNLILWAWGRELLFDSGGATYETSNWREYSIDTFSHNTVLVDGLPQRRRTTDASANVPNQPVDADWISTPSYDFAAASYGYGYGVINNRIATHTRRVLFVKPDIFIVSDTLEPNDSNEHTYQARWHLLTTNTQVDTIAVTNGNTTSALPLAVVTTDVGLPNLAIVPLQYGNLQVRTASGQTEPEILGWNFLRDKIPDREPATTVLHTRKGPGVQRFLTLLYPLKPNASNPVQAVEVISLTVKRITLTDGRIFLLNVPLSPRDAITLSELEE